MITVWRALQRGSILVNIKTTEDKILGSTTTIWTSITTTILFRKQPLRTNYCNSMLKTAISMEEVVYNIL